MTPMIAISGWRTLWEAIIGTPAIAPTVVKTRAPIIQASGRFA